MSGLESIIPYTLFGTSIITDTVATYFHVRKDGFQVEGNAYHRKGIEEDGPEYLFKRGLAVVVLNSAVFIGVGYSIDYLVGIQDAPINLHKGFCYTMGTLEYLQAVSHTAGIYDNKYTNWIRPLVIRFNRLLYINR